MSSRHHFSVFVTVEQKIKNKEVIAEADARRVKGEKKNDFITRYCYSEEERVAAISELGPDPEINPIQRSW